MARNRPKLEVTYEYIAGEDSARRRSQTFELLFRDKGKSLQYLFHAQSLRADRINPGVR